MIFQLDGRYMELADPAQYPVKIKTEFVQATERSSSGIVHVEDFKVQTGERTYSFADMKNDDYLLLMDWFVNVTRGMLYEFQLTDDLGYTATVRFTTSTLDFSTNFLNLWTGSFSVREEK